MSLPTLQTVKDFLRIETNASDTELQGILARATGLVRHFIDRPIEATAKVYSLYGDGARAYRHITRLFIRDTPVKLTSPAPVIVDGDGETVDTSTYAVDSDSGEIRAAVGEVFASFPYTISATVGLAVSSDYATRVEPVIQAAIIDTCADFYFRKNPGATQESVGGGVSVSYGAFGLPLRVEQSLMMLRRVGVA